MLTQAIVAQIRRRESHRLGSSCAGRFLTPLLVIGVPLGKIFKHSPSPDCCHFPGVFALLAQMLCGELELRQPTDREAECPSSAHMPSYGLTL